MRIKVIGLSAFLLGAAWTMLPAGCADDRQAASAPSATRTPPTPALPRDVLWSRTSAEYAAVCEEVYALATATLPVLTETALKEPADPRRPAVVMDLDETVLDNSLFNVWVTIDRERHDRGEPCAPGDRLPNGELKVNDSVWAQWVNGHDDTALAVPGAIKFIAAARARGLAVVYVTNRPEFTKEGAVEKCRAKTIATLVRVGALPPNTPDEALRDTLLMKADAPSSKDARRAATELKFRVVALVGDNLADFSTGYEHGAFKTGGWEARRTLASMAPDNARWGARWFVLPNPMYGDWNDSRDVMTREQVNDIRAKAPAFMPEAPRTGS